MCKCDPNLRTPYCGKGDCKPPNSSESPVLTGYVNTAELLKLIAGWEVEGGFLDNEHDDIGDRSIGKTYKQCASELRNVLDT